MSNNKLNQDDSSVEVNTTHCDCLEQLETAETYQPLEGKKIESVYFEEAANTYNFTRGTSGRRIVLHQIVRLEGNKKSRKLVFYPAFCCFCGASFNKEK